MIRYCLKCTSAVPDHLAVKRHGDIRCPRCGDRLYYLGKEAVRLSSPSVFSEYDDRTYAVSALANYQGGVGHIETPFTEDIHKLECEELLRYNPKNIPVLYQLGRLYQSRFQFMQAKESYQHILSLDEAHVDARLRMAEICLSEHRFEDAIRHLDQVIHAIPEDPMLHFDFAVAHYFASRLAMSIRHLKIADDLSADPDFKKTVRDVLDQLQNG